MSEERTPSEIIKRNAERAAEGQPAPTKPEFTLMRQAVKSQTLCKSYFA